jgi:hypothetical protein
MLRLADNSALERRANGFGFRMYVQFVVNAANVIAQCIDGDVESVGSGLVAVTLG